MNKSELNAAERRLDLLLYLSQKRRSSYNDLINRYNVSAPVVRNDLQYIEDVFRVPLIRRRGRAGSIFVSNPTWNIHQRYLNKNQEVVIKKILQNLSQEEREVLQSVLDDFTVGK